MNLFLEVLAKRPDAYHDYLALLWLPNPTVAGGSNDAAAALVGLNNR